MRPPLPSPATEPADVPPSRALITALTLLLRARDTARGLGPDPWEFAVGLPELLAAGLAGTDVRWLMAKGYVLQALERVRPHEKRRSFRQHANLALTPRSSFLLTDAGAIFLDHWRPSPPPTAVLDAPSDSAPTCSLAVPHWDNALRKLWYRNTLVKWFRVPAESQETILAAFQEENWPPRIDDPLGYVHGQDPHERLHEAVKGLNRGQVQRLLEFHRDGTGEGVMWAARQGQ
jgi:hypothetical protein